MWSLKSKDKWEDREEEFVEELLLDEEEEEAEEESGELIWDIVKSVE